MEAFPEPALRADDVRRLASRPDAARDLAPCLRSGPRDLRRHGEAQEVLAQTGRRVALRTLAARLTVGIGLGAALPQAALAPAASAHDRITPAAETMALRGPVLPVDRIEPDMPGAADRDDASPPVVAEPGWTAVGLPEESPATTALVFADLKELSGAVSQDLGLRPRDPGEALRFGAVSIPRWLVETILRASDETDVDPVYLMALADKESSFDPEARASTSSAEGLFQFLSQTWFELVRTYGPKHGLAIEASAIADRGGQLTIADAGLRDRVLGLRRDPYTAAVMAGEMMKRDRARVELRLGRELKRSECYLAHFFGAASAGRFMALADGKPKQSAAATFRAAAQANRSLFYTRVGKKVRGLTVAEVYARLDDMIDRRLDRFRTVAGVVSTPLASGAPGVRLDSTLSLFP